MAKGIYGRLVANGMMWQRTDEALAEWNNRLAAVAESVLQLQGDAAYQFLNGAGSRSAPRPDGLTAAQAEPALRAMLTFHEQFALLQAMLAQAAALRASAPRLFGAEHRLAELQHLLTGKSVRLAGKPNAGTATDETVSLNDLMNSMNGSLAEARTLTQAVSRAQGEMAASMDEAQSRLQQMGSLPPGSTSAQAVAIGSAAHLLRDLRAKLQTDPLGAAADWRQQVEPLLARAAEAFARAEGNRTKLLAARTLFEQLADMQQGSRAARAEAQLKVASCETLPLPVADGTLHGLSEWLQRLESGQTEENVDAMTSGLRHWMVAAETCAAESRRILTACRAPVEQRNELRGRLQALKAKARAYGVAELPRLAEQAGEAEACLYTRPSDLRRAAAAVAAFENALGLSRKEVVRP